MEAFKIIIPAGYTVQNTENDNIDVNIVLSNGQVYYGTLFTILNIQSLMKQQNDLYFWAEDMIIVRDLKKETIKNAVFKIIDDELLEVSFSKIGTINSVFSKEISFEKIQATI